MIDLVFVLMICFQSSLGHCTWGQKKESKDTYGQTRGLSNLEMKHVGKLAIIGALLKAVKTSYGRTIQGRTYKAQGF